MIAESYTGGEWLLVTIEERARAVVAHFPAIPLPVRRELEEVICRAMKRAVAQVLSELEVDADQESIRGEGRGKQGKGYDPSAVFWHRWWAAKLRNARVRGQVSGSSPLRGDVRIM